MTLYLTQNAPALGRKKKSAASVKVNFLFVF